MSKQKFSVLGVIPTLREGGALEVGFNFVFIVFLAAAFLVSGFFVFQGINNADAAATNIAIQSPTAGDKWRGEQLIKWTADGNPGDKVFIYYSSTGVFPPNEGGEGVLIGEFDFDADSAPWNTSGLNGSNFKILITDTLAQFSGATSTGTFIVDNTAPTTSIDFSIPADPTTEWYNIVTGKPTITLTCTDNLSGCSSVSWSFDGVSFTEVSSDTATILSADIPEGELTLHFFSKDNTIDNDNNHNEETVKNESFKVDTVAPLVSSYTLDGLEADAFFNPTTPDSVEIVLNADEPVKFNTIRVLNSLDTTVKSFSQTDSFETTATKNWDGTESPEGSGIVVPDGEYRLKPKIVDVAGNETDVVIGPHNIFVDTEDPTITENPLTNPVADEVYKDTPGVPFTFTPNDTGSGPLTCSYSTDGGATFNNLTTCENGSPTDETATAGFVDGRNSVIVRVTDSADNSFTTSPISIVFDTNDTLTVDDDNPADFDNIQEAIQKATAGDTIKVTDGNYSEPIGTCDGNDAMFCVDKSLTITGDPGGNPDVGPGPGAPVVDGGDQNTSVFVIASSVSNVTIEGFIVQNFANPVGQGGVGSAVLSWNTGATNITVQDNHLLDLGWNGVLAGSDDGSLQSGWLVQRNIIEDAAYAGVELTNVTDSQVLDNEISVSNGNWDVGDSGVGIEVAVRAFGAGQNITAGTNVVVSNNTISDAGADARAGVNLLARAYTGTSIAVLSGVSVEGNEITNNSIRGIFVVAEERNGGSAQVSNLTIEGDDITDNETGIEFGLPSSSPHENGTYEANTITITGNNIIDNGFGFDNTTGTLLTVEDNYWGSPNGPEHGSNTFNVGEQGDAVSDNVDFTPWCQTVGPTGCDFAPVTISNPTQFSSIQAAVNAASPGDTINVVAGNFSEAVTVNKSVTILGIQNGNDARTRTGDESIVGISTGGFFLEADNIVLDGFTVTDITACNVGSVATSKDASGYQILNNVLRDNDLGMKLRSDGAVQTKVQFNLFKDNDWAFHNSACDQVAKGLQTGFGGDNPLSNALIDSNKFTGHDEGGDSYAMNFVAGQGGHSDVTISNNEVLDSSVVLGDSSGFVISGNTIQMNDLDSSTAIFIAGNVVELEITDNTIDGQQRGIWIAPDFFGVPTPSSDIEVRFNIITGNPTFGIEIATGRYDGTLDAEKNWFGSVRGPTNTTNNPLPSGATAGDEVSDDVDFSPWCIEVPSGDPLDCALGSSDPLAAFVVDTDDLDEVKTGVQVHMFVNNPLTVTAIDAASITLINFDGSVQFLADGGAAFAPGPSQFNSGDWDLGVASTTITNDKLGSVNIDAQGQGASSGKSGNLQVEFVHPDGIVVTAIENKSDSAQADGTFENGFHYLYKVSVFDAALTNLFVKFADWQQSDGPGVIPILDGAAPSGSNARMLIDESGGTGGVVGGFTEIVILNGSGDLKSYVLGNKYDDSVVTLPANISAIDLSADPGRQIEFNVFFRIPSDTPAGFYTTEFGIKAE